MLFPVFFGRLDARNQMNWYWTLLLHDQIVGTEASVEFLDTQNLIKQTKHLEFKI